VVNRLEKYRLLCYTVWMIIEPIALLLIILYARRIIQLLQEMSA